MCARIADVLEGKETSLRWAEEGLIMEPNIENSRNLIGGGTGTQQLA